MSGRLRRIQDFFRFVAGKEIFVKPEISCSPERFGSDHGGWDLLTTELDRNSVVYSFGIGLDATFDIALIERFDLTVFAFDPTPKSIEWVNQQDFPDQFVMHHYGIASIDGTLSFHPPENPDHVSHTVLDRPVTRENALVFPVFRLRTIMEKLGHSRINVLKMDVEGAEYDIIDDLAESGIRPDQLLIEFHTRFPGVGAAMTRKALRTLNSIGYRLYSVSATNRELCFVNSRA